MQSQASTVDQYLTEVPAKRMEALERLRTLCVTHLTGYEESMVYGMPSYSKDGTVAVSFASQKQYISLYILKQEVFDRHRPGVGRSQPGQGLHPLHQAGEDRLRRGGTALGRHGGVGCGDLLMDYAAYRKAYFTAPPPPPRFDFTGPFGITLYYADFAEAVNFYTQVLGPPAYIEGTGTRGWPLGTGWLTLLRGKSGNPTNMEVTVKMATPAEAERLHRAFITAGGTGEEPSDQLIYVPLRACTVRDPFGVEWFIVGVLGEG